MATPLLHRIQLRTGLYADPASVAVGFFATVGADASALYSLDGDWSLDLSVPLTDRLATAVKRRQVIRLIFTDGSFTEWVIDDVVVETGAGDPMVRITGSSVLMLLADATLAESVDVTGASTFAGAYTGSLTQFWDNVILPFCTAAGLTVFARGMVDPVEVRTFTWAFGDTPLSLCRAAASLTKTELVPRRNGTSGYYVDWVYKYNAALSSVVVRARKNLRALRSTASAREQANLLYVQGANDSGGTPYHVERVGWQVAAVNGGSQRLTLASPVGGIGPISEDDQFNTASVRQYYLLRRKTGRLYQILDTLSASQEVALPDVSDIAAGEFVEFREDNTTAIAEHVYGDGKSVLRATVVSLSYLTLDNPVTNADAVAADGDYVDWMTRISVEVLATTLVAATPSLYADGRMKLASVAGLQVGDWGVIVTNAAPPWVLYNQWGIFTITAIDTPNSTVTASPRYPWQHPWTPSAVNLISNRVRIFRERGLTPLVTASAGATNIVTVSSPTGIVANDIVEVIQRTGGKQLARLISPSSVVAFGRKVGTVERPDYGGDTVLNPNAICETWTGGPTSLPDGWEKSASGSVARVSGLQYGSYALDVTGAAIASPVTRVPAGVGQGRLALAIVFKVKTGFGWDASTTAQMRFGLLMGNVAAGNVPAAGYYVAVYGPAFTSPPSGARIVRENEVVTLTLENLDVEYTQAISYGVKATLWSNVNVVIDGMWIFAGTRAPSTWTEYGQGTRLWQEAASQLQLVAAPETYDIDVIDIAAVDGVNYPFSDLELGRTVKLIDPDSNTARPGLRIQQRRVVFFDPEQGSLVVATRPRTLSEMLSGAVVQAGKIKYGGRVEAR